MSRNNCRLAVYEASTRSRRSVTTTPLPSRLPCSDARSAARSMPGAVRTSALPGAAAGPNAAVTAGTLMMTGHRCWPGSMP